MTSRLDALVAAAALALDGSTDGRAVCTLTKSGVSVPGVKYAEGRWAALREAQRSSHHDDVSDDTVVAPVLAAWTAQLDSVRAKGAGTDWIAYRSGGVDALTELAATDAGTP